MTSFYIPNTLFFCFRLYKQKRLSFPVVQEAKMTFKKRTF